MEVLHSVFKWPHDQWSQLDRPWCVVFQNALLCLSLSRLVRCSPKFTRKHGLVFSCSCSIRSAQWSPIIHRIKDRMFWRSVFTTLRHMTWARGYPLPWPPMCFRESVCSCICTRIELSTQRTLEVVSNAPKQNTIVFGVTHPARSSSMQGIKGRLYAVKCSVHGLYSSWSRG